jgi:glycosyltransferase involved in cell wall biosynthesis
MRIMWVVGRMPSPVAVARGIPPIGGGFWQDALLESVRTTGRFDLLVAYLGSERGDARTIDGVEFRDIGPEEVREPVVRIARRWLPSGPDRRCLEECAAVAAAWRPDLVHFHGTESGLGLAATTIGSPWVLSIQGIRTAIEAAAVSADRAWPGGVITSPGEFARGLSPWHERRMLHSSAKIERSILRDCRYVLGRTEFDRRVTSVLAPDARYWRVGEMLREAFAASRWSPRRDYGEGPVTLCAIASKFEGKGMHVALDAVRILLDVGPDVHLDVIGFDSRSLAGRRFDAYARSLGIDDRVRLMGNLSAEAVIDELLAADAYLHPSLADNSPNALCEAMTLGVPCVASTAGGISSLATDGEDALLVPPGDAHSLSGALRGLLADRDLAIRLSGAARSRASARHDPEAVVTQLLTAYDEIAAGSDVGAGRQWADPVE